MNSKIKIILVMALAFGITQLSNGTIFLAGTPKLRPNLPQYLAFRTESLASPFQQRYLSFIQSLHFNQSNGSKSSPTNNNSDAFLKSMSKGVYAEEDKKTGEVKKIEMRLDEVQWKEQSIIVDGKKCSVSFPEGVVLPENVLKKICK